jgi:hypothetical protein
MIEDIAAEDEAKLQNSFGAYDTCNGKGQKWDLLLIKHLSPLKKMCIKNANWISVGATDECETAASIYQCGRKEAPQVTNDLYSLQLGNSTVVWTEFTAPLLFYHYKFCVSLV